MPGLKIKLTTEEAQEASDKFRDKLDKLADQAVLTEKEVSKLEKRMLAGLRADKARKEIDKITKATKMSRLETMKFQAKMRDWSGIWKTFSKGAVQAKRHLFSLKSAIIALGIGTLGKSFLQAASAAEQAQVKLRVLLGSARKGQEVFKDLAQYAATVPFELEKIMNAGARLGALKNFGQEGIMKWMPVLADAAAVFNIDIEVAAAQMMRMFNTGAASADMFRERGVLAMLGFKVGVHYSVAETKRIMWDAWTDVNSQFRNATQEMAKTWDGLMSMLLDKWFLFRIELMESGPFDEIKAMARVINNDLSEILFGGDSQEEIEKWGKKIVEALNGFLTVAGILGNFIQVVNLGIQTIYTGFLSINVVIQGVGNSILGIWENIFYYLDVGADKLNTFLNLANWFKSEEEWTPLLTISGTDDSPFGNSDKPDYNDNFFNPEETKKAIADLERQAQGVNDMFDDMLNGGAASDIIARFKKRVQEELEVMRNEISNEERTPGIPEHIWSWGKKGKAAYDAQMAAIAKMKTKINTFSASPFEKSMEETVDKFEADIAKIIATTYVKGDEPDQIADNEREKQLIIEARNELFKWEKDYLKLVEHRRQVELAQTQKQIDLEAELADIKMRSEVGTLSQNTEIKETIRLQKALIASKVEYANKNQWIKQHDLAGWIQLQDEIKKAKRELSEYAAIEANRWGGAIQQNIFTTNQVIQQGIKNYTDSLDTMYEAWVNMTESMLEVTQTTLADELETLFTDGSTDWFENMWDAWQKLMNRMLAEILARDFMEALLGKPGSNTTSQTGGLVGWIKDLLKGGASSPTGQGGGIGGVVGKGVDWVKELFGMDTGSTDIQTKNPSGRIDGEFDEIKAMVEQDKEQAGLPRPEEFTQAVENANIRIDNHITIDGAKYETSSSKSVGQDTAIGSSAIDEIKEKARLPEEVVQAVEAVEATSIPSSAPFSFGPEPDVNNFQTQGAVGFDKAGVATAEELEVVGIKFTDRLSPAFASIVDGVDSTAQFFLKNFEGVMGFLDDLTGDMFNLFAKFKSFIGTEPGTGGGILSNTLNFGAELLGIGGGQDVSAIGTGSSAFGADSGAAWDALGRSGPGGYRAGGGDVKKGMPYIVGEVGQEVFIPHQDGKIIPNSKLDNINLGAGLSDMVFNPESKVSQPSAKNNVVNFENYQRRAAGGDVKKDQPYIVGEKGQEVFIPNTDGNVIPNSQTQTLNPGGSEIHGQVKDVGDDFTTGGLDPAFDKIVEDTETVGKGFVEEFGKTVHDITSGMTGKGAGFTEGGGSTEGGSNPSAWIGFGLMAAGLFLGGGSGTSEKEESAKPKAAGGNVKKGELYEVGELGREGFIPHTDGRVVPNSKLNTSQQTSGGDKYSFDMPINVKDNTNIPPWVQDLRDEFEELADRRIQEAM